jgi:hypothetical protein
MLRQVTRPESLAEAALWELCAEYGYCIGGEAADAIASDPPEDADSFLDAVLRAEGYEQPELFDKRDREQLLAVVRDWLFDNGQGRGTKSGLPRVRRAD